MDEHSGLAYQKSNRRTIERLARIENSKEKETVKVAFRGT